MIDEKNIKMIEEYARQYATALILFGVDISGKYDSAVKMSAALGQAYLRGRADGMEYMYESKSKVGKWVLCSDGLPEEYEVLCCDKYGNILVGHPFRYNDDVFCAESYNEFMSGCVAWMPLPEPYKGKKV